MQIPGLNLLSESPSTYPSKEVVPSEENIVPTAPTVSLDVNENSSSTLPSFELLKDPPNGQSTNVVSPAVEDVKDPFEQKITSATDAVENDPDPLDVALEQSDHSSAESVHEEENESEDDGSTSSESDEEVSEIIKLAHLGTLEGQEDDYDEAEDGAAPKTGGLRTKNEIVEETNRVGLTDISINDDTVIEYLGNVERVMDSVAIVVAHTGGEYRVLDEGGVLVTEARKVLGTISETFGPVKQPRYVVRLVESLDTSEYPVPEQKLFYVPEYASYVFTQAIRGLKGSDASNLYDEEVNDAEMEFSDDEAEMEYKRGLKRKRQQNAAQKSGRPENNAGAPQPKRAPSGGYAQVQGYRPLARPTNLDSLPESTPFRTPSTSLPVERGRDRKPVREEYYQHQRRPDRAPYYPTDYSNSSPYSPQNPSIPGFGPPSQDFQMYDRPLQSPPVYPVAPFNDDHTSRGYAPPLPAGAYVNPAFFNRPNLPAQLPQEQQLMDILRNARQPPK